MINRTLIRTRALQTLYAHCHRDEASINDSIKTFGISLERTYDLYLYLLSIIPALTDKESELVEIRKSKHLAKESELNPNMRFVNNKLSDIISKSLKINKWNEEKSLYWDDEIIRHLLTKIDATTNMDEYMNSEYSLTSDIDFFIEILKKVVYKDEELASYLESKSIYWDDELSYIEKMDCDEDNVDLDAIDEIIDRCKSQNRYNSERLLTSSVEVVKDFTLKTLRKVESEGDIDNCIIPMYKDQDDERFGVHLLRQAIINYKDYLKIIEDHLSDQWDKERLPDMDVAIMVLAITEFIHFPNIPISVTINEYVELSKCYSTPKSSVFVNGVVDAVANYLRNEKKILK